MGSYIIAAVDICWCKFHLHNVNTVKFIFPLFFFLKQNQRFVSCMVPPLWDIANG